MMIIINYHAHIDDCQHLGGDWQATKFRWLVWTQRMEIMEHKNRGLFLYHKRVQNFNNECALLTEQHSCFYSLKHIK